MIRGYKGEITMRKILLMSAAALAVAGVTGQAFAADMPVRTPRPAYKAPYAAPIYNWQGFYVGIAGGYGWGNSEHTSAGASSGEFDVDGWLVGGTMGYNWQQGAGVFGIEADISWTNMNGGNGGGALGFPVRTELDWLSTVRARAGFVADASLFYVTGGAAFGDVEARGGVARGSDWQTGWTVGAGIETMLGQGWTTKLEYLYVDLGDSNLYTNGAAVNVEKIGRAHV